MTRIAVNPASRPELDPGFVPAVLWNREYRRLAETGGRDLTIALLRPDGSGSAYRTRMLADTPENFAATLRYVERLIKFLLWQKGGCTVVLAGADDRLTAELRKLYAPGGAAARDAEVMGPVVYGQPFELRNCPLADAPAPREKTVRLGGHWNGCRIGFDLGGSDRKCAAVIDGKTVHSEEVVWDPYFQKDPEYHIRGIRDSIARAAAKLPRVDAIGGSAAGIYVDNAPRLASLFRGIAPGDFAEKIVPLFRDIQRDYGIPLIVANDGEVTALAGAMSMGDNAVLGISMGTSEAAGYVTPDGNITDWLNELAFAPVDYRETGAPRDEWSGDFGCGVSYFSQQGVARLAPAAGFDFPDSLPLPKRLVAVQDAMQAGDDRAAAIFRTLGTCFGYALAHYADFYELRNVLILGRVTSGRGGELLMSTAEKLIAAEFPELKLRFRVPDEQFKRHGQAVIAASLPEVNA